MKEFLWINSDGPAITRDQNSDIRRHVMLGYRSKLQNDDSPGGVLLQSDKAPCRECQLRQLVKDLARPECQKCYQERIKSFGQEASEASDTQRVSSPSTADRPSEELTGGDDTSTNTIGDGKLSQLSQDYLRETMALLSLHGQELENDDQYLVQAVTYSK